MKINKCEICGENLIKNGRTAAGTQRWICKHCKSSSVKKYNSEIHDLKQFVGWLLSKKRLADMPGTGRTFQRKVKKFWSIWPLSPIVDEVHEVIFMDGIYLSKNVVLLIASSTKHVLAWYLARAENSRSWGALMNRIAPPKMVVTDGGTGFRKACKNIWPSVAVQRCLFHVFCQIKRYTTSRPKLEAGKELYEIARALLHVDTLKKAQVWVDAYLKWSSKWDAFLNEKTVFEDGRREYTHERLRSARSSLSYLINSGTIFTFLNPLINEDKKFPSTNNRIEGGVNAQLRELLRNHKGLSTLKRAKACFWWCYMHTECPASYSQILKTMPTDESISKEYQSLLYNERNFATVPQWGDAIVWGEFHHSDPWQHDWD